MRPGRSQDDWIRMNRGRGGLEGTLSEDRVGSTVLGWGDAEPESGGSDECLPLWERLQRG